jgi:hypothetical protein
LKQVFYAIHENLVANANPEILEAVGRSVTEEISLLKLAIMLRSSSDRAGMTISQPTK